MARLRTTARLIGGVAALVVSTGLMVAEAAAVLTSSPPPPGTVTVADDDGGQAMFAVDDLAPGHPVAGCVAITYEADAIGALRLYGMGHGTDLDPALRLAVEAGTGGGHGDCVGFRGTRLFDGTLEEFNRVHHDFASGVAAAVAPHPEPMVFRFVAEVLDDNGAQGRHALATFTWEARHVGVADIVAPDPEAPATVTEGPATDNLDTDGGPSPEPALVRPPTPTSAPEAVAPSAAPASRREASRAAAPPRPLVTPLARAGERSLAQAIVQGVLAVTKKAAFPAVPLFVAGAFVLAQDRIDRRDPKLALAPVYPDPDLVFTGRQP